MTSRSLPCLPMTARAPTGRMLAARWHALQAGWRAARWVWAQQAPPLPPQALHSLSHLDERTLADIGLPPGARAWLAHARVRQADGLWVTSRGAVAPSVERSFY